MKVPFQDFQNSSPLWLLWVQRISGRIDLRVPILLFFNFVSRQVVRFFTVFEGVHYHNYVRVRKLVQNWYTYVLHLILDCWTTSLGPRTENLNFSLCENVRGILLVNLCSNGSSILLPCQVIQNGINFLDMSCQTDLIPDPFFGNKA